MPASHHRRPDNAWYFGPFFQDDFRVHPRVTLNLGLRYDLQLPITDPQDRKLTFVEGARSQVVPAALPGLLFPGDQGPNGKIPRGIANTDLNNIAPRIGVAWDPAGNAKTAVRAAFGVFYGSIAGNQWNTTADTQPFAIRQRFDDVRSLSDPYGNRPGGISPFPYVFDPRSPRFLLPAAVGGPSLDFVWPYTYQMNLSVQRQLTSSTSVTAAYVGSRGRNLQIDLDANYPVFGPGATSTNIDARRPILPGTLGRINVQHSILGNSYNAPTSSGIRV
jgi:hypothetical protein